MKNLLVFSLLVILIVSCASNTSDKTTNESTTDASIAPQTEHEENDYSFDIAIQWNGAIEEEGEEEYIDNQTQFFSNNGNYMGLSIFGGGMEIKDFDNNSHIVKYEETTEVTDIEHKESRVIDFTATKEQTKVAGYETIKYTWKDDAGNTGEIWYATELKFPVTENGYLSPTVQLHLAPQSAKLGVPLKAKGQLANGQTYDLEVSKIYDVKD